MSKKENNEHYGIPLVGRNGSINVALKSTIFDEGEQPQALLKAYVAVPGENFSDENEVFEVWGMKNVQMMTECVIPLMDKIALRMSSAGVPVRPEIRKSMSGFDSPPPEIKVLGSQDKPNDPQSVSVTITEVPKRKGKVLQVLQMVMGLPAADAKELLSSIPARIICPGEDAAKVLLATLSQAGCGCEIKVEPQEDDEELF